MKKLKFRNQIVATLIFMLLLTACYEFDFINQPYQADPDSFFDVQISVTKVYSNYGGTAYFGVMLPNGWTIVDSI
jgi:hypothetical protein